MTNARETVIFVSCWQNADSKIFLRSCIWHIELLQGGYFNTEWTEILKVEDALQ